MAQLSYGDSPVAFDGLISDVRYHTIATYVAANDILFGKGVAISEVDNKAYTPAPNQAVVEYDADFVADNEIEFTVNGQTVTVDFDTNQADTVTALVAAVDALDNVTAEATDTGGNNREVTVRSLDMPISVSTEVTGGAGQADATVVLSADDLIIGGITTHTHTRPNSFTTGESTYKTGDLVNVMTVGGVYVAGETALNIGDDLFVRIVAGGDGEVPGNIRNDNDGGDAVALPNSRVLRPAAAGEFAVIEVNSP